MSKRVEALVTKLVMPKVEEMGYEFVDVGFEKEGQDFVLTVYISKPGGITVDDCEKVSIAIDPIIEDADPIEQSYFLSVSSVGLERPLKTQKDYERNMGKEIVLKLFAPIDKKKEFVGVLKSADGDAVTITCEGNDIRFNIKDIALAKPYLKF